MKVEKHTGVYGIISKNNKLLLIKKARGPYTGLYDLPGGSIKLGETAVDALIREIKEETNCHLKNQNLLDFDVVNYKYKIENEDYVLQHFAALYEVDIDKDCILKKDGDGRDSNGCEWVDADFINESNSTVFVLKAINLLTKIYGN